MWSVGVGAVKYHQSLLHCRDGVWPKSAPSTGVGDIGRKTGKTRVVLVSDSSSPLPQSLSAHQRTREQSEIAAISTKPYKNCGAGLFFEIEEPLT